MITSILAAVDLGPVAGDVLSSAAAMSRALGAELHIMHVSESVSGSTLPSAVADALRRDEELLQTLVENTVTGVTPASVSVRSGHPAESILVEAMARRADLIVLGPHAQQDIQARLFGTTADRVVREARLPVLIARGRLNTSLGVVAVPTDYSTAATHATRFAGRLAAALRGGGGAPVLHLLHVDSPIEQPADEANESGSGSARLTAAERVLREAGAGDDARSLVIGAGDAADRLREWSTRNGADLIIMGTTGRTRAGQILLGSVATRLARSAPCPVLLVPRPIDPAYRAPRLDSVVVGVDFSAASLGAADWTLAELMPGLRKLVLHVVEEPETTEYASMDRAVRLELLRELRASAEAHMAQRFPALQDSERRIVVGRSVEMLIQVAHEEDADIIAVGGHTHPRGLWSTLGSTAERLVHSSDVSVLVVKGRPAGPPTRILAAVDGSQAGPGVLRWAGLIARRFDAQVIAAHVMNTRYVGAARRVSGMTAGKRVERSFEQQTADWLARVAREAALGESAELVVASGDPPLELLALQQRTAADLIVIGSHGAGNIRSALLGSVAYSVVCGSTCPTLVVRG